MSDSQSCEVDYDRGWTLWDDMKRYGPMSRHTRRLVWQVVAGLEFGSVLDVGCGQGSPLAEIARRRPSVELAGVDMSKKAVELARLRLPAASFAVLDITAGALERKFDLVLCTDVLEHIPEDVAALRNIRRMCRRWCLVSSLQGRMRGHELPMGHVRNYRRGELRARMEEAGFAVRRQIDWGFPLYSPLYRDLLRGVPAAATSGEYGTGRRMLSTLLYYLFFLNLWKFGDYVFCLGEVR